MINRGESNPFFKVEKDLGHRVSTPKHVNSIVQDEIEQTDLLQIPMPNVPITEPKTNTLRDIHSRIPEMGLKAPKVDWSQYNFVKEVKDKMY